MLDPVVRHLNPTTLSSCGCFLLLLLLLFLLKAMRNWSLQKDADLSKRKVTNFVPTLLSNIAQSHLCSIPSGQCILSLIFCAILFSSCFPKVPLSAWPGQCPHPKHQTCHWGEALQFDKSYLMSFSFLLCKTGTVILFSHGCWNNHRRIIVNSVLCIKHDF